MRVFAIILFLALLGLQYRLWISDSGVREVRRLEESVAAQKLENAQLAERNQQLAAEVKDLKEGLAAVEERARSDLGMVGANESFYQVVTPPPAGIAPPDAPAGDSTPEAGMSAATGDDARATHQAAR